MFQYILKRILIFVPTFFVISLIIFGLSKMAPGDPVDILMVGSTDNGGNLSNVAGNEEAYIQKSKELGLDKPVFYFTVSSKAFPKNLYSIPKKHKRELAYRLINLYGNAEAVLAYLEQLNKLEIHTSQIPNDSVFYEIKNFVGQTSRELFINYDPVNIQFKVDTLHAIFSRMPAANIKQLQTICKTLKQKYDYLQAHPTTHKLYIPQIYFYGLKNQYHTWMFGDYPWFQAVDSSAHHRIDTIYKEMANLNFQIDTLTKTKHKLEKALQLAKTSITANDSLQNLSPVEVDSLVDHTTNLTRNLIPVETKITKLLKEKKHLNTEKKKLQKQVVVYASRGFLRGDFGTSYKDNRPVSTRMGEALQWTLIINFFAILLSYLISIPIGVQSGLWKKYPTKQVPFLNFSTLLCAVLMVFSFFRYLKWGGDFNTHCQIIVFIHIIFFILTYLLFTPASNKFTRLNLKNFISQLTQLRFFNLANVTTLVLKILYLWLWTVLCFMFLLMPLPLQSILVLIPVIIWIIHKLKKRSSNFKLSIYGLTVTGQLLDNLTTTILFILYSLPSFWIATLLITFFTTDEYGAVFDLFPTAGVQTQNIATNPNASWWIVYSDIAYHLVLPIFCVTYGSLAYLSRQMRGAMLNVVRQDYIRTAHAKGLNEKQVTWKHAFRNALFPIITLFSSIFPRALSGAIAIELIYNIPGMGVLVLGAITERDWPVVFTVAMLASILTMIGNLVADILYAIVDPRISFK